MGACERCAEIVEILLQRVLPDVAQRLHAEGLLLRLAEAGEAADIAGEVIGKPPCVARADGEGLGALALLIGPGLVACDALKAVVVEIGFRELAIVDDIHAAVDLLANNFRNLVAQLHAERRQFFLLSGSLGQNQPREFRRTWKRPGVGRQYAFFAAKHATFPPKRCL